MKAARERCTRRPLVLSALVQNYAGFWKCRTDIGEVMVKNLPTEVILPKERGFFSRVIFRQRFLKFVLVGIAAPIGIRRATNWQLAPKR